MESMLVALPRVRATAGFAERRVADDDTYLEPGDSAFYALTDFRRVSPVAVEADASIDAALADMNRLGVHALLVVKQVSHEEDSQIIGLITKYNIERERPHRYDKTSVFIKPRHASVGDVMTPSEELSLVRFESLQTLAAIEAYEMFQGTGLTHLLVIETQGDDLFVARGLLSRATLARRLRRTHTISSG
jgi:CBS domain-containing protein